VKIFSKTDVLLFPDHGVDGSTDQY